MSIELRILSGARAGQTEAFEKSVIAIGRHPMSDFRFDVAHDLDVSTKHGEIRGIDGRYTVHDNNSTNGTFVNGARVPAGGARELRDGDVIAFGAHGPTVAVHIHGRHVTPIGEKATLLETPAFGAAAQPASGAPRRPTTERIAIAVREQTRGLKLAIGALVVVLGAVAAAALVLSRQQSTRRDDEIKRLAAAYDSTSRSFAARLQGMNDTALTNDLRRENDSLMRAVHDAHGAEQATVAQQAIERSHELLRSASQMDLPSVRDANDPAIVFIYTEIGDRAFEATGFDVAKSGLVVTNRHVVSDSSGRATRLRVKFANSRAWHPAHIARLADDPASDLALLQIDDAGPFPTVTAVAPTVDTPVGGSIATLGYPLGTGIAMEGTGDDFMAKTSLTIGTVSKSTDDILQINAFATHGSSGSPVLDGHGHVIGVVSRGPAGADGQIVYAVPAPKIVELLRGTPR
ncbi:MAG TPA: trypsin-like peptidase domain-containing protein [Gemmatimonadaceae bacterium]|nr:trypsin-like peptidase domain-containing protein [Gemmatimonadaceae bacterium]